MTLVTNDTVQWCRCVDALSCRLEGEDDPQLWKSAVDLAVSDWSEKVHGYDGKEAFILEIGCCSHWIRPHWKTRSGMRNPSGYDPTTTGFSFRSLPRLDWSLRWKFETETNTWVEVKGQPSRRPLTFQIAIPARTARHNQATVSAVWLPGSPANPASKLVAVYGFERTDDNWRLFARAEQQRN